MMWKILSIGNSFSQDAQRFLHRLAVAGGVENETVNLYIGGCSLEQHWNNVQQDAAAYEYQQNGEPAQRMASIRETLLETHWDIVTFQQASHDSGLPETYFPYICQLSQYVRELAPDAKQWIHETWAYEADSSHDCFPRYHCDQQEMYQQLTEAYAQAARAINAPLLPCGHVIQALRATPAFDTQKNGLSLCRDGYHMSYLYGRYALAATWYETLWGGILENHFIPEEADLPPADPALLALIRQTAAKVCSK